MLFRIMLLENHLVAYLTLYMEVTRGKLERNAVLFAISNGCIWLNAMCNLDLNMSG